MTASGPGDPDPTPPFRSPEDEEEQRRRAQEEGSAAGPVADGAGYAGDAAESVADARGGSGCNGPSCDGPGCDGCDGPDCGCDLLLFVRLSTVLLVVAALVPAVGADRVVCAAIRGYRRWLSRFTPACPGTPSCSTYALAAVRGLGARRGLVAAARRIERCRRPRAHPPGRPAPTHR